MTLFGAFNEVLTPDVLAKIASYEDEPAEKTTKAVEGLVHTVFGGLLKRTTTEIGVNQLFSQLQKSGYDGSLTTDLSAVLKDATLTHTVITNGNEAISRLLPAMKSSIAGMISSYAGIRNSSAISLLGLTAAVVLDVLGRQVKEKKLTADGLAASLFDQREAFINAVPEGLFPQLVEKVGIQQIVAGVAAPARSNAPSASIRPSATRPIPASTVSFEPEPDSGSDGSAGKWLIGLALLTALGVGGFFIYQNSIKNSDNPNEALSTEVPANSSDSAAADTVARSLAVPVDTSAARPVSASVTSATTATGVAVANPGATDATFNTALTTYLNDPVQPKGRIFGLTGVTFAPGSLTMTPASQGQVNELIAQLKARPTMQVQFQGYADDAPVGSGITNKALSFKRVNVLKQQLVTAGINYLRVDAIGLGTGVKVGELGKQPQRKINVKIISK
ncbi:DUF937 domain-containing protein [Fibrella aquatilis]|uniref:DUF937 domain-containing protein n=1 Tax=Fibrella aquatilis TaxID=2817059 RepID=A0A939G737_9BACT|nr:DUF937 domain-containing protein [Fibrella aquatilis]MBO0933627.1 DUF937 domain-containing protein [Fibrella aquatilis]